MTSSKNNPPQPGTVTGIRAQARDSQRVNLMIDDEFALGISLDTLAHEGIFVGQYLDAERIQQLMAADAYDRAKQTAIRLLELRPRSQREINDRLRQRGFSNDTIQQVITRLGEAGLLNDAAFAQYLVEQRRNSGQRGSIAIQHDLRRHGIHQHIISAHMHADGLVDEDMAQALAHARKLLPRVRGADRATFLRRVGGALQRRGFPLAAVKQALAITWQEHTQATSDPDVADSGIIDPDDE